MAKQKKSATRLRSWRDIPDSSHRSFPSLQHPLSLSPGPEVVLAVVCGSSEARAIVASYYGCVLPVRIMEVIQ